MKTILAVALLAIVLPTLHAAEPPPPTAPPVTITLQGRHGHATPVREGFTHTGGGTTDVAQPSPDTVIVTMYGVVVAGGHPCKDSVASLQFTLEQCFEITIDDPKVKRAKITIEARAVGLLRSEKKGAGTASMAQACATVSCGPAQVVALCLEPHSVAGGESLSINDHLGPVSGPVASGPYTLNETFLITATHPRSLCCKPASAEFAPDPALDPLWISYWEPFHGAIKKDFGFQVIIRVAPDNGERGESSKP
jgi:hypothetical protein